MLDLSRYLPYLVNRVGFAVAEVFSESLADASLTVPSWRVLAVLLGRGSLRIGALAVETSIDVSTLSRLVGSLQRRGLVARKIAKDDARVVNVALTARGRSIATALVPAAHALERRLVDGMPEEEVAELKRLLVKLHANIIDATANVDAASHP